MILNIHIPKVFITVFILSIAFFTQSIAQIDSGYVEIKGGKLYYEIYGEGKPLVFLNGGPGISSEAYRYVHEKFDTCTQVIIFDQRGTGKSKLHRINRMTIRIKHMVDDLEKLRLHLGITKWDVVGQSFGGSYALNYAVKHSEKIDKLILISTAGFDKETTGGFQKFDYPKINQMTEPELRLLDTIKTLTNENNTDPYQLTKYRIALRSRYYVYDSSNIEKQINWFTHKAVHSYDVKKYLRESLKYIDIGRKLKNIDNQTLILYGWSDFIPFRVPDKIHQLLPNSELEIFQNCGHSIWLDKEQEARVCISKFLFDEQKAECYSTPN